jgi:two-component system OmpR family sensor kinase
MASIRTRLTAWNGGVLVFLLLVFAVAAYVFLRSAALAQIDHSLHQQMRLLTLTARAPVEEEKEGSVMDAFVRDLESDALLVTVAPGMPNTLVTAPARIEQDEEERQRKPAGRRSAGPDLDWSDLAQKIKSPRDSNKAFSVRGPHGGSRVLTERLVIASQPTLLVATQPLHETIELLETAQYAALIALPIAVLLAIVSGNALARRALDPVASMVSEARQIGVRNLHERLSIRNPNDELGRLAMTFNDVLERVDRALEQQRRFTADASHELRTPIALIRAEADVALSGSSGGEGEYRAALTVIRDASQQLSRIVNDLFLLARADAGQTLIAPHAMRLDELVATTAHGMRALADQRGLELKVGALPSVAYEGDEELLRRALRNLLDNAIKYSNGPGCIGLSLDGDGTNYRISVDDSGPGIPTDDQAHIFERFYRGDRARGHRESSTGAGAGLGLAIAREIAELHGGRVELRRSSESGSSFDLILPAIWN